MSEIRLNAESAAALAHAFATVLQMQGNFRTPAASLQMQQTAVSQVCQLTAEAQQRNKVVFPAPGPGFNRVLVSPKGLDTQQIGVGPLSMFVGFMQVNPQTIGEAARSTGGDDVQALLPQTTIDPVTGNPVAVVTQVDLPVPDGDIAISLILANGNAQNPATVNVVLTWYRVA